MYNYSNSYNFAISHLIWHQFVTGLINNELATKMLVSHCFTSIVAK